nr:MAG TPA: hypothetical protein [Caudoviricetes sp.]
MSDGLQGSIPCKVLAIIVARNKKQDNKEKEKNYEKCYF